MWFCDLKWKRPMWQQCNIQTAKQMAALVESHGLTPHQYADDTQIYGSCLPSHVDDLSSTISGCVNDVADWMQSNRLQNLIRGRRNCCGARPVGARTDFQPPHWQSALRPSPRCPRYATWASSLTPTWWCALTCVRRCRTALQHCVSCAAFVTSSRRPSFSRLLLL